MAYNILIVDDSATTRALIKRVIKLAELPVGDFYEAGDGRAALEFLECVKPDLVLADLNMPEMDGFEMTRRMESDSTMKDIPLVLISAEPNAQAFAEAHAQIKGCLRKPFTPEGVRNLLQELLGVVHA